MRASHVIISMLAGLVPLTACSSSDTGGTSSDRPLSADLTQGPLLAASCSGCHQSGGDALMAVSGRSEADMLAVLQTYKTDGDGTSVMHRIARGFSDEDLSVIARYLSKTQDPAP